MRLSDIVRQANEIAKKFTSYLSVSLLFYFFLNRDVTSMTQVKEQKTISTEKNEIIFNIRL